MHIYIYIRQRCQKEKTSNIFPREFSFSSSRERREKIKEGIWVFTAYIFVRQTYP